MKPFETKLTLRIYDTKLIEKMNMILKFNPNRYQSKNQLLLELLELGVRENSKKSPRRRHTFERGEIYSLSAKG